MADDDALQYCSEAILFVLIFGMSATVDPRDVLGQFKRLTPLVVGMSCQFVLLPLCGFATVHILQLDAAIAVPLLITVASPGGAFSNLCCSLCNADLAVSVAMTTVSTATAIAVLPLNILLFVKVLMGSSKIDVPIIGLIEPLGVVVGAVTLGMVASYCLPAWRSRFNRIGGIFGLALVLLAVCQPRENTQSTGHVSWAKVIGSVSLTCFMGMLVTTAASTVVPGISRPERIAIVIETVFQNTSIALAIAMREPDAIEGIAVPLMYGIMEVFFVVIYAFAAWRLGWTYASPSDNICRVLLDNYQPGRCLAVVAPQPDTVEELEEPTKSEKSDIALTAASTDSTLDSTESGPASLNMLNARSPRQPRQETGRGTPVPYETAALGVPVPPLPLERSFAGRDSSSGTPRAPLQTLR